MEDVGLSRRTSFDENYDLEHDENRAVREKWGEFGDTLEQGVKKQAIIDKVVQEIHGLNTDKLAAFYPFRKQSKKVNYQNRMHNLLRKYNM